MRWLMFAICSWPLLFANASDLVEVGLPQGSTIRIPEEFFHDVNIVKTKGKRTLFESRSSQGDTIFLYARFHYIPGLERANDLVSMADSEGMISRLKELGMEDPTFTPIRDGFYDRDIPGVVHRISGGKFDQHIMSLYRKIDHEGASLFLMLSPEPSFYRHSPAFQEMIISYQSGAIVRDKNTISPLALIATVFLLLANIVFIWFGFKEIAHPHDVRHTA